MKFVKLKRKYHVEVSAPVLKTWKPSKGAPARVAHVGVGWVSLCGAGDVLSMVPVSKPCADRLGLTLCRSCELKLTKRGDLPRARKPRKKRG